MDGDLLRADTAVKDELDSIDDAWKQPRFDSLQHVVKILTSPDPEEAIQTLREQRDAIEDLVDDVVRRYHKGFNKAIHNYSQILRLFSESSSSLNGLKTSIAEAKKLLGTRHKQLQQQWYRSIMHQHVISLLDQIENVAKVPAKIEKLIADKRYYAAVQLYIQSVNLLEREGIQGIGALQEVRSEFSKLRGVLFYKVVEDLHNHLYNRGEYSLSLHARDGQEDDLSNIEAIIPPPGSIHPISRRTRTFRRNDIQGSSFDSRTLADGYRQGSTDGNSSGDFRDDESNQNGDSTDGTSESFSAKVAPNGKLSGDDLASKEIRKASQNPPTWLADAMPNEFTEGIRKSDAPLNTKYLQTMVECIAMLGKVAASGALISQRLRQMVHEVITAEIRARASSADSSKLAMGRVSNGASSVPSRFQLRNGVQRSKNQRRSAVGQSFSEIGAGSLMGPAGPAQVAAQGLLESILALIIQILENHVIVGEALEVRSTEASTVFEHSPGKPDLQWNNDLDSNRALGGYSLGFVLMVIQSECQQLICDILRATPDAASADAAVQTARLASKTPSNDKSNGIVEEGLSFAFRFTDTVLAMPGAGNDAMARGTTVDVARVARGRRGTGNPQEGYGIGAALFERGIYLTASVYKPVLQFTDKVSSLLPQKYAQLGKDGLQSFIENFIKDQFLPIVYVDYRTRVADALASPAAFRPKPHLGSVYLAPSESKTILQGPFASHQLANEALEWAHAMPKYAGEFLELVQTILERTLERCRAVYTEAVLGSLSCSFIGRTDVQQLMKQDPQNALLEVSYLAEPGQNNSASMRLDVEAREVEDEMNNLLLSLRPIKQEHLIRDDQKIIVLAALSESLDFLSSSIEQLGQKRSQKKKENQRQSLHQRSSSALTTGLSDLTARYRSLSAECLRTLRVEMQLEAIYHLQAMTDRVYMSDQDAEEPEDFIVSFTTQMTRWDDEMTSYTSDSKRNYIFGGICGISATAFVKALNNMSLLNLFGIRQICRNCIGLQQALAALSSSDGEMVQQRLDDVRTYYELLNMPFEALFAFVSEHQSKFTFSEYSSLLKVNVPGREIPPDAVQRIGKVLAPAI